MSTLDVTAQSDQLWTWSPFVNLSNATLGDGQFEPKLAADPFGNVHVFWTAEQSGGPVVMYAKRDAGGKWQPAADVIASSSRLLVTAVDVTSSGIVRLLLVGRDGLYFSWASGGEAQSARAWSMPTAIADNPATGSGWSADMVADAEGTIHVIYGAGDSANVFHLTSNDGGRTWTQPAPIGDLGNIGTEEVASEVRLALDQRQRLHATWVARELPRGWPGTRMFYARSTDNGASWSQPLLIDDWKSGAYPEDRGPFFPSVAVAASEEVHLVWSGAPIGQRWHQWSPDGGITWSEKRLIPLFDGLWEGIPGTTGFVDLAVDSLDRVYAVTVIGNSGSPRIGIWENQNWVRREDSSNGEHTCEDPRMALGLGNQLNVVCVGQSGTDFDVWYVMAQISAPYIPARSIVAVPTSLSTEAIATAPSTSAIVPTNMGHSSKSIDPQRPAWPTLSMPAAVALSGTLSLLIVGVGIGGWFLARRRSSFLR